MRQIVTKALLASLFISLVVVLWLNIKGSTPRGSEKDYDLSKKIFQAVVRDRGYTYGYKQPLKPVKDFKFTDYKERYKVRFQWLYNSEVAFVYSAHYDSRRKSIKVVGFRHRWLEPENSDISCLYPDGSPPKPLAVLHNISVADPRPGLEYNTFVWSCPWEGLTTINNIVIKSSDKTTSILVSDERLSIGQQKSPKPVICVKPLIRNYTDAYQLEEFISMNEILGASKIVLYKSNISAEIIQPVLDKYSNTDFVDVYDWELPVDVTKLHTAGQKTHNQHCFYTYMSLYKWIAFIDLDELIVPTKVFGSLADMLEQALTAANNKTQSLKMGGFNIHSKMCPTALPDDEIYRNQLPSEPLCRLTSLRKTNCTPALDIGIWSKPIALTDYAEIIDIHALEPVGDVTSIDLDPELATVHHYRNNMTTCLIVKQSSWRNKRDTNLHPYMNEALSHLPQLCQKTNPLAL